MDPMLLIGGTALFLWLFGKKNMQAGTGAAAAGLTVLDSNSKGIKYKLFGGGQSVTSWIYFGDKDQIQQQADCLFIATSLPDKSGFSFFVYKKGIVQDTLIYSTAYTVGTSQPA